MHIASRYYYYHSSASSDFLLLEDGSKFILEDDGGFISLEAVLTWILASGVWNDAAYWLDHKLWID